MHYPLYVKNVYKQVDPCSSFARDVLIPSVQAVSALVMSYKIRIAISITLDVIQYVC